MLKYSNKFRHLPCQMPPSSSISIALLLLLTIFTVLLDASEMGDELKHVGDRVSDAVNEVADVKGGQLWCPVPVAGTKCPSSSPFHYYRCCGQLNNECCMRLQTWTFILLVAFGVGLAAILLVSILRCVFCRRNN